VGRDYILESEPVYNGEYQCPDSLVGEIEESVGCWARCWVGENRRQVPCWAWLR